MMKAGIIGGSEFIGCNILLKFLVEDYRVKVQISGKTRMKRNPLFQNICKNRNLEISETELTDVADFQMFIEDCDIIVHCGQPFRLDIKTSEVPIYVPLIKGTGNLLKALQNNNSVRKAIFITSATAFNPDYSSLSGLHKTAKNDSGRKVKISEVEKAKYHAEKAVSKMLDSFPGNLFEVVYISPVEVKDYALSNSNASTSSGLQFLFRKKITPDPSFQKILKRQAIDNFTTIDELPDKVFRAAKSEKTENMPAIKNGQLTAHF